MKYGDQEKLRFLTSTSLELSKVSWHIVKLQSYTTVARSEHA
jgi:hypothetical protein